MNNPTTAPARQVLQAALEAAYEAAKAERARLYNRYTDLTAEEREEMRAVVSEVAQQAWRASHSSK